MKVRVRETATVTGRIRKDVVACVNQRQETVVADEAMVLFGSPRASQGG